MKKLVNYGLLTAASLALLTPPIHSADPAIGVVPVDAKKAAQLLKENSSLMVLDIRTPQEFESGHIAGAKSIDFNAKDFAQKLEALDKGKTYLLHCRSGRRSGKSLETFKKLNFQSIYHLEGGINDWVKAGLPLKKP